MANPIAPPTADQYPEFFKTYIGHVAHEADLATALERQQAVIAALGRLPADRAAFRYAEAKWSVKEAIGHITDAERIFSYRLLRIARGDETPLPAFDENKYALSSQADRRELADLVQELAAVRESSLALVRSLDEQALGNRGTVRAGDITARAQAFVIAGHFAHHARILKERYGLALP
jgi:uncharacterized damage-inducible protein DinB